MYPGTGVIKQLEPGVEQVVQGEPQLPSRPSSPLVTVARPEKRTEPLPTAPRAAMPSQEQIAQQQAIQLISGQPCLIWNRYIGGDQDWRELVRWNIPIGFTGDLRELAIQSNNDAKTRFRIVLGDVDQSIPTDRQLTTPIAAPWRNTIIPGGRSVFVEVRSTDGTSINVDATITGVVR